MCSWTVAAVRHEDFDTSGGIIAVSARCSISLVRGKSFRSAEVEEI